MMFDHQASINNKIVEGQQSLKGFAGKLTADVTEIKSNVRVVNEKVDNVDGKVDVVDEKVDNVDGKVDVVHAKVDVLQRIVITNDFKRGQRSKFLPSLPLTFDGETGSCGLVPVGFKNRFGVYSEHCVFSIKFMERFFRYECPEAVDIEETRAFFKQSENFPRSSYFSKSENYKDLLRLILKTPFAFLAVGKNWSSKGPENRARFVVTPLDFLKKLLKAIDEHFPDRDRVRNFVDVGSAPNYKLEGNDYAFRQVSEDDMSTGQIRVIKQCISAEDKVFIPAMCRPWTSENYNSVVQRFFDVPSDVVKDGQLTRHVVAGVVKREGPRVKTHRETTGATIDESWDKKCKKRKRSTGRC